MARRQRRDIYRRREDPGFDINRDVDLVHLRSLMGPVEVNETEHNFYGLYCQNIIRIMLNGAKFRGYPEQVKDSMAFEAIVDLVRARKKFKGDAYPQPTAPFNYLFRIGYHSFQHVLKNYYASTAELEEIPASMVGVGTLTASGEEFDGDILEKATGWEAIEECLAEATGC